jgi:hypothetical protein
MSEDPLDRFLRRPLLGLPLRMVLDDRWHMRLAVLAMAGMATWMYGKSYSHAHAEKPAGG